MLVRVDSGGCSSPLTSVYQTLTVTPTRVGERPRPLIVGAPTREKPPGALLPPLLPSSPVFDPRLPALPDLPVVVARAGAAAAARASASGLAQLAQDRAPRAAVPAQPGPPRPRAEAPARERPPAQGCRAPLPVDGRARLLLARRAGRPGLARPDPAHRLPERRALVRLRGEHRLRGRARPRARAA